MAETDLERTEAPTPRRRQEYRQQGNVARSVDLTAAISLVVSFLLFYVLGENLIFGMKRIVGSLLAADHTANLTRPDDIGAAVSFAGRVGVAAVVPVIVALVVVPLIATVAQVGILFTVRPLQPQFSRISPLRGAKNLFNKRGAVRLLMSLGKVAVVSVVAAWCIARDLPGMVALAHLEAAPMMATISLMVFSMALKLGAVLLALAILDYAFQRWQREQDMKMTRQDLREEMRNLEGDPLTKERRTRVARQLALQRIGHAVPQANVVVTNPTHYAVALEYDSGRMGAPRLVAKGAELMALRIRQIAVANDVPIVERKELARVLYLNVEIGQEVPPQFYHAVAEILAYVYRLSRRPA